MRSQTEEAIADIWEDAKPVIEEFLNDVRYVPSYLWNCGGNS